jgi:hypothetical protein
VKNGINLYGQTNFVGSSRRPRRFESQIASNLSPHFASAGDLKDNGAAKRGFPHP